MGYRDLWLWDGERKIGNCVMGHVTDQVTGSPATSVATRMGNSFFLNVVMTLSLSPWDMSPWRRPTRERERENIGSVWLLRYFWITEFLDNWLMQNYKHTKYYINGNVMQGHLSETCLAQKFIV